VYSGGQTVDVFWKGTDGSLWHLWTADGTTWNGPQDLGGGPLGSAPHAVAAGNGDVDVFWKGTDSHLWEASYTTDLGWWGPNGLAAYSGALGSDPQPVDVNGTIEVFWADPDGNLGYAAYDNGWSRPGN